MSISPEAKESRSTRLVCAKLYEGGLFSSYEILNNIKQAPFKGKSPEYDLDIDLITKHAEVAFKHHIKFALMALVLSFLGLAFYIEYSELSYVFSVSAISLLLLKDIYDRYIALNHFSKKNFDINYNLASSSNKPKSFLTRICDWIIQNNKIDERKKQNVITFGDYFPFLGAGQRVRNWNFVIDPSKLQKNKDDIKNPTICPINQTELAKKQNSTELSLITLYETACDGI